MVYKFVHIFILLREDVVFFKILSDSWISRPYYVTFENSQCLHGHFTVQSSLRFRDHGVLSALNIHYRTSDIVRSSAEVKRSWLPCLAPSILTVRPPGVGFRSSTRHVEMRRMSGVMYIVTKPRQNWLWERVTAFISNGTAHTSTCLMYIDLPKNFYVMRTFEASLRYYSSCKTWI